MTDEQGISHEVNISHDRTTPSNMDHAGFFYRYLAFRIDGMVSVLFMFIIGLFYLFYFIRFHGAWDGLLFLFFFLITFTISELLYFVVMECKWNTVGKKIANIKVVNFHGGRITWKQAFTRNLERIIWMIPFLGQIYLYLSTQNIRNDDQRFGDSWANTYVIKTYHEPMADQSASDYTPDLIRHRGF